MKTLPFTLSMAAALACTSALAADKETLLTGVTAPVMVNQGEAYIEATDGMLLYPGDQLMVMQGGSAQVQYANGCTQSLGSNQISQVSTADACVSASAAGTYNQAGSTTSGGGSTTPPSPGGANPPSTVTKVVGYGLAIGAVGYAAYEITDDDDNNKGNRPPVSP